MKIIITGGTGLIARYTVQEMVKRGLKVDTIVSDDRVEFAEELYNDAQGVEVIPKSDFLDNKYQIRNIPGSFVIHTAFTRKNDGYKIAESLDYAYSVFDICKRNNSAGIINISSRSVYEEPKEGEVNTEESPLNDDSLIATAKHATELLAKSFFGDSSIRYTNLRIASVNELKLDNNMVRPLNIFVDCVIEGKSIQVYNGNQVMSFVDPHDVANALALICESSVDWKEIYNVGAGSLCTEKLINMASRVNDIGEEFGFSRVEINIIEKDIHQTAGMSIELIHRDFGYEPVVSLDDMIRSLFKMKVKSDD